jgi:hypothetical protein
MEIPAKMDFTYKKDDNRKLFKSLEENPVFGILEAQNYIPLYNSYFALNKTNYNTIMLNHAWKIQEILAQESNNVFKCQLKRNDTKNTRKVFLKFSPLLDPIKYLMGKYDITDTTLLNLPAFDSSACNSKVRDYNNAAYVDSFFTYLSSKLLHDHGFLHGMDFYGSFLALKNDFRINIIDDIEYLNDSNFFRKNDKILYELEENGLDEFNGDTRNYKKKLNFSNELATEELMLTDITDLNTLSLDKTVRELVEPELVEPELVEPELVEPELVEPELVEPELVTIELTDALERAPTKSNNSSCSSRSSNTTNEGDLEDDEGEDSETSDDEEESLEPDGGDAIEEEWDSESEEDDEETLIAKIKKFPVQVIALEHCESTLDEYMSDGKITPEIWDSIVIQILFSLITFQNAFGLTHNDLHTNNVMYIETDKKFLYYKLNHVYYRVPTFGKLFKIIDYGRAIYKFRGQLLCSDSYHPEGDAATQYNCEPYYNDKKPRLEPNFGFDLCRLGCALYDYLMDEPKSKIVQIMLDWVKDDKGRNILYKKNGDERYPDFKLYKMIARTANKHVPAAVLSNPYFDKFIVPKKELVKKMKEVMDLDAIPNYM